MKPTSSFLNLPQSGIRRMYDLAKNKKDTVSFVLGEPDFVTQTNAYYVICTGGILRYWQ